MKHIKPDFNKAQVSVHEDSFEEHLIKQEKAERERAKLHYIHGIQGVDGGKCYEGEKTY